MATIKLKDGKVILKDGKVSCECCCPCGGAVGDNDLTLTIHVTDHHGAGTVVTSPWFGTKVTSCDWVHPTAQAYVQWQCSISRWVCGEALGGAGGVFGYKKTSFASGPVGSYYSNADGTGTLMQTVTT
jgi:hypothetical protein